MAGKPHFEIYREGLQADGTESLADILSNKPKGPTHGQWRWRLVGGNGEPMASGEAYTTQKAMLDTMNAILGLGADTKVVTVDGRR